MAIPGIVVLYYLVSLLVEPNSALAQTVYPTGTTVYEEGLAYDRVTFYPSVDQRAKLVDMQGTLIHEWWLPDSSDGLFYPLYKPIPESPGHTLAVQTKSVNELDWDSRVVWQFVAPVNLGVGEFDGSVEFHHDVVRRANGNTLILCAVLVQVPTISPKPLRDDCILEVTPAGEIVWKWFTFQHVDEFGFTADARRLIAQARNNGDWAHADAISEIPPNQHSHPALTPGNLLVSYRELSTMIVIDKVTGAIVGKVGPDNNLTIGQHQPEMLPPDLPGAGNVLTFDNGGEAGYPMQFRSFSRVVEFDPTTLEMVLNYDATRSGRLPYTLFSPFVGRAQRLPNGNTLAVEGLKGRLFEFTLTGRLVWEYMTPFSAVLTQPPGIAVQVPGVYRAYRLPFFWAEGWENMGWSVPDENKRRRSWAR
jgi:Arylsulfotransferase (ASST)